ncbi:MAG: Tim44/TimA family putative adaptor protein [Pseudomonadota bacterium]
MDFDLFTILPLAAAIFVFWKLRSVLGTRTGNEQRPPYDPYNGADNDTGPERGVEASTDAAEANDNVVTLPGSRSRRADDGMTTAQKAIESIAGKDAGLKKSLLAIASRDSDFNPSEFLDGAKIAYEMIVTGFADGDKRSLKNLLSREVFENFESVIDDRQANGEKVQTSFVGTEKATIVAADVTKEEAQLTVRFISQMISATLDSNDEIIDGDPEEVAEIVDVWTFARPLKSRDPNWKLVATDE